MKPEVSIAQVYQSVPEAVREAMELAELKYNYHLIPYASPQPPGLGGHSVV